MTNAIATKSSLWSVSRVIFSGLLLGFVLSVVAEKYIGGDVGAQQPCFQTPCSTACDPANGGLGSCPPQENQLLRIPQNTLITVNIDPAWRNVNGVDMTGCIRQAVENWQNAPNNYSGITFEVHTCAQPNNIPRNFVQIIPPVDLLPPGATVGSVARTTRVPDPNSPQNLYNASIQVDRRVTNCEALTEAIAHEFGHIMGTEDCNTCCAGTSVMTPGRCTAVDASGTCIAQDYNDVTFGRPDPGGCDMATANQANGWNPMTVNRPPAGPDPCAPGGGDECGGDPCCNNPCCGDPCCGDPCCGDDQCCGDYCCAHPGSPECETCYEVCETVCGDNETCLDEDPYTRECYLWGSDVCWEECHTECY